MESEEIPSALTSLAAGAIAGLTVDIALFPLDTFKTRIQSEQGFWKSGGFKQIYKGIGPTAAGSAPCAALFFFTYNETKGLLSPHINHSWSSLNHVLSASIAEVVVNMVKVPVEVVKQRRQTTVATPLAIIRDALRREGARGLYRGFGCTVLRDVPFSMLQFPLWEALKVRARGVMGRETTPAESALSGAIAGAVAGAATTPLDLAKTRIMLAEAPQQSMLAVLRQIHAAGGVGGLFAGFLPRTTFIFLGGGVFFGCYEFSRELVETFSFFRNRTVNS